MRNARDEPRPSMIRATTKKFLEMLVYINPNRIFVLYYFPSTSRLRILFFLSCIVADLWKNAVSRSPCLTQFTLVRGLHMISSFLYNCWIRILRLCRLWSSSWVRSLTSWHFSKLSMSRATCFFVLRTDLKDSSSHPRRALRRHLSLVDNTSGASRQLTGMSKLS